MSTNHTPGLWEVATWSSRADIKRTVYAVRRSIGVGLAEYLRTPSGTVRRFRTLEAARAAIAAANKEQT